MGETVAVAYFKVLSHIRLERD